MNHQAELETAEKMNALVLAASRKGAEDAVAKTQGVSHKCLIDLDGTVMLERVVEALIDSNQCRRIIVAIEDRQLLQSVPRLAQLLEQGNIEFLPSGENLFASIAAVTSMGDVWPLMITTGDNALHTPEMIEHFCAELRRLKPDVAAGMTPADVILKAYPDGKRAFHDLKDGGWSSCNLYALMNAEALKSAKAFEGGGQFGKKPSRLLKAFGLGFVIHYKFKLSTLAQLGERLSKRWNLNIQPIRMPFADAPIDVDNPGDMVRTEAILRKRRGAE